MSKEQQWNPAIFRKNDIRGVYKKDFDLTFVQKLASTFVDFYWQQKEKETSGHPSSLMVAIGYDARLSSPEIAQCLIKSLQQAGAHTCSLGLSPTPLCFFASYFVKEISAGIMVTASHNPPDFNGFKMMINQESLCDEKITQLYNLGRKPPDKGCRTVLPTVDLNQATPAQQITPNVESAYIAFLKKDFLTQEVLCRGSAFESADTSKVDMKLRNSNKNWTNIVVDCGNGATGPLAQKVFQAFTATNSKTPITLKETSIGDLRLQTQSIVSDSLPVRVHYLFAEPDGRFPNHHPDPSIESHLQDLKTAVQKTHSHFGIAFDGDGDRLVVVGKNGHILQGDELMSIFISDILNQTGFEKGVALGPFSTSKVHKKLENLNNIPKTTNRPLVVADVKCGDWFFDFLKEKGLPFVMWKSGHSLIRQKTIEKKAAFGGELSGHFFFYDEGYPIDDGLYGLLRLIEISQKTQKRPTRKAGDRTLSHSIDCDSELSSKTTTIETPARKAGDRTLPHSIDCDSELSSKTSIETPEIRYPIKDGAKKKLEKLKNFYKKQDQAHCVFIDGLRVSFPGQAWGLARFSNTQNEWTFRFGGKTQAELNKIQADFYHLLNINIPP